MCMWGDIFAPLNSLGLPTKMMHRQDNRTATVWRWSMMSIVAALGRLPSTSHSCKKQKNPQFRQPVSQKLAWKSGISRLFLGCLVELNGIETVQNVQVPKSSIQIHRRLACSPKGGWDGDGQAHEHQHQATSEHVRKKAGEVIPWNQHATMSGLLQNRMDLGM